MPNNIVLCLIDNDDMCHAVSKELVDRQDIRLDIKDDPRLFYSSLDSHEIGCIIVDVDVRNMLAHTVMDDVRRRNIIAPVIIVTNYNNTPQAIQLVKDGAFDVLEKPFRLGMLSSRVSGALKLREENERLYVERMAALPKLDKLTKRQYQIVRLIANGLNAGEVGVKLGLSKATVNNNMNNIIRKMGIKGRGDIVNWTEAVRKYEEMVGRVEDKPIPAFGWILKEY